MLCSPPKLFSNCFLDLTKEPKLMCANPSQSRTVKLLSELNTNTCSTKSRWAQVEPKAWSIENEPKKSWAMFGLDLAWIQPSTLYMLFWHQNFTPLHINMSNHDNINFIILIIFSWLNMMNNRVTICFRLNGLVIV